jgi:hypothetical protein
MLKFYKFAILLLCLFLPIQNLLVQFLVVRLGYPFWISLWKEIIVIIIIIFTLLFLIRKIIRNQKDYLSWGKLYPLFLFIFANILIVLTSYINKSPLGNFLVGYRFELLWVGFFSIVVSTINCLDKYEKEQLADFIPKIKTAMITGFIPILGISIYSLVFGQENVLQFFGFGLETGKYITKSPLAHVIDGGGFSDSLRLGGGFSTPNHFAAYLLLLFGIFFNKKYFKLTWIISLLLLFFIILSFARYSWLVVIFSILIIFSAKIFQLFSWPKKIRNTLVGFFLIAPFIISVVAINLPYEILTSKLPVFIAKPSSTSLHRMHIMTSLDILKEDKSKIFLGYGLGVSGPAAKEEYNNIYKNPLVAKYSYIPYRWGLVERDMLIPENWFLQVLINGGLIYLILYLGIVFIPVWFLIKEFSKTKLDYHRVILLLGIYGLILGNTLLHIWENQTVAIYWTLIWITLFDKNHYVLYT